MKYILIECIHFLGRSDNLTSIFDMLPDSAFSASSINYVHHNPAASRLHKTLDYSWIPGSAQTGEYITANLGSAYDVVAVASQGRTDQPSQYLTQFKLLHSMDGVNFEYVVDDSNEHYLFSLSHAIQDTVEYNMLPYTVHATHVRLEVVQFNSFAAVRWDVFFIDTSKIYLYIPYTCRDKRIYM